MTEPKPCPFCQCPVRVFMAVKGFNGMRDRYAIAHPEGTDCIIDGMETLSYADKDQLIEDWNRRSCE